MRGGCTNTGKRFVHVWISTHLRSDNGKEFTGKKIKDFCETNSITQVHGAPGTPTTQRLVERGNRTLKENLINILREKKAELNIWCSEAAYKINITIHDATKQIPYVAVFGTKPWKETNNNGLSTEDNDETSTLSHRLHHPRKGS